MDYRTVYDTMADAHAAEGIGRSANAHYTNAISRRTRRRGGKAMNGKKIQEGVLKLFGFERMRGGLTYTEAHERFGDCIVTTTGHMCALQAGALQDTFDGRTYVWPTPYCAECLILARLDCVPFVEGVSGPNISASGQEPCHGCKERQKLFFYDVTRERKARSVWVLTRSAWRGLGMAAGGLKRR